MLYVRTFKTYKHWTFTESTLANIILNSTSEDLDIFYRFWTNITFLLLLLLYISFLNISTMGNEKETSSQRKRRTLERKKKHV